MVKDFIKNIPSFNTILDYRAYRDSLGDIKFHYGCAGKNIDEILLELEVPYITITRVKHLQAILRKLTLYKLLKEKAQNVKG